MVSPFVLKLSVMLLLKAAILQHELLKHENKETIFENLVPVQKRSSFLNQRISISS